MRILPGMLQFLSLLSSFSMGAFWPVVKRIMELCLKNSCWSISFAKETFLQLDMELGHWVIGLVLPTCNYVFSLSTAHFKMAFCCTDAAVYVYSYGWKFRIRGVKDISEHWGRSFVNGLCQQFYCYKKKKKENIYWQWKKIQLLNKKPGSLQLFCRLYALSDSVYEFVDLSISGHSSTYAALQLLCW